MHTNPKPAITVPVKVVRVVDADTVDVEACLKIRVRLADCWAPESRTELGARATEAAKIAMPEGSSAILQISLEQVDELRDVMTFGRVVGRLFNPVGDVSQMMVDMGYATREKPRG